MSVGRPAEISELRFVGTTWYDRGIRYWWLRFWIIMFWFIVMAIILSVMVIFVDAMIAQASTAAVQVTIGVVCAVPILRSCLSANMQLRRTAEERSAGLPVHFPEREHRIHPRSATGMGVAAIGGGVLAAFFVALSSLFVVGQVVGIFRTTLGKYLSVEEWNAARAYGLEPELADPSEQFRRARPVPPRLKFERRR